MVSELTSIVVKGLAGIVVRELASTVVKELASIVVRKCFTALKVNIMVTFVKYSSLHGHHHLLITTCSPTHVPITCSPSAHHHMLTKKSLSPCRSARSPTLTTTTWRQMTQSVTS